MSEIYSLDRVKEVLKEWIDNNSSLKYDQLRVLLRNWKGSKLERDERLLITQTLLNKRKDVLSLNRNKKDVINKKKKFIVLTAHSNDGYYSKMGRLCAKMNSLYCEAYSYTFRHVVKTPIDMRSIIETRAPSYLKIKLLLDLFDEYKTIIDEEKGKDDCMYYIMWIDADAIFINPSISLNHIVNKAGGRELIIGEDHTPACLLNSGVFLLKVCEWCHDLVKEVWTESRFYSKRHFEQSAIVTILKRNQEGLLFHAPTNELVVDSKDNNINKRFFSYLSHDYTWKLFPHVCVIPRRDFNTGIMDTDNIVKDNKNEQALYIFHPAGRRKKFECLLEMIEMRKLYAQYEQQFGIEVPSEQEDIVD